MNHIHPSKTSGPFETQLKNEGLVKQVDVLVIGGGPAALGLIINSIKNNR